jgi:uncharacterized protein (TIGR03435 family)
LQHAQLIAIASTLAAAVVVASYTDAVAFQGSGRAEFDVVSIKPTKTLPGGAIPLSQSFGVGTLALTGVTPHELIARAYSVRPNQVSGPSRIDEEHYDIVAKTAGPSSYVEQGLMLRAMLADRFQLVIHRETKELPVYELTVGKNGPKMPAATTDDAGPRFYPNSPGIAARQTSMQRFAELLSARVDRPVLDRTGRSGKFDITLTWAPDSADPNAEPGPSIFAAIRDQLGLKLEPGKAAVEIIVVERIAAPSPN